MPTIFQSRARSAARRGDAEAGHRRSDGALVLVCREVRFEWYHRLLSVSLKHPCRRHRRSCAADNSMLNEFVGRHRNAMAYEIIGRGHDHARDCRDELGRRRFGCKAANVARGVTVRMPKLVGMLIRNTPRSSAPSRTLCSASSSAARIGSMRARKSAPASVGTTARVRRERSRVPRSVSRSAMREALDCERPHSRAAAEKLPSLATR